MSSPPPPPKDAWPEDAGPYAYRPPAGPGPAGPSLFFAVVFALVHAAVLAASVAVTMIVGPRYEKLFRDLGLKLDPLTQLALGVTRWLYNYWYVLVIFMMPCLVADAAILFFLHRSPRARRWSYVWAVGIILLLVLTFGCLDGSMWWSYSKLLDALSR